MQPAQPGQGGQTEPSEPPEQPKRERPDYDQALKRMLTRAHDAIPGDQALLAPDLTWVGERPTELQGRPRRADLVWEVRSAQGSPGLLHIELQTEPDAAMGERIVIVSELRLRRREVLQALRRNPMIDELVRKSSLFEEAMAEGEVKGELKGLRAMVQLVLEGRFGTLDPALLAVIAAADEATLRAVGKHAATDSLDALRAQLGASQNQPDQPNQQGQNA